MTSLTTKWSTHRDFFLRTQLFHLTKEKVAIVQLVFGSDLAGHIAHRSRLNQQHLDGT